MCAVRQGLTCRTKEESKEKTSVNKRQASGAILFGWGDSLLRDMLSAGVFDCLNGLFDDIKVSMRCCVLSVRSPLWQILQISHYAGKSAWQILEKLKDGKDEQVCELHDARAAGREVVVCYWGLQNCLQRGTYIDAVVGICSVLRG